MFPDVYNLDKAHADDSHVERPVHLLWPMYWLDQSDKSTHLFHFISFSFLGYVYWVKLSQEHKVKV